MSIDNEKREFEIAGAIALNTPATICCEKVQFRVLDCRNQATRLTKAEDCGTASIRLGNKNRNCNYMHACYDVASSELNMTYATQIHSKLNSKFEQQAQTTQNRYSHLSSQSSSSTATTGIVELMLINRGQRHTLSPICHARGGRRTAGICP